MIPVSMIPVFMIPVFMIPVFMIPVFVYSYPITQPIIKGAFIVRQLSVHSSRGAIQQGRQSKKHDILPASIFIRVLD